MVNVSPEAPLKLKRAIQLGEDYDVSHFRQQQWLADDRRLRRNNFPGLRDWQRLFFDAGTMSSLHVRCVDL
jgi:hypothetical protein